MRFPEKEPTLNTLFKTVTVSLVDPECDPKILISKSCVERQSIPEYIRSIEAMLLELGYTRYNNSYGSSLLKYSNDTKYEIYITIRDTKIVNAYNKEVNKKKIEKMVKLLNQKI